MRLDCAICLSVDNPPREADTVIDGFAVCYDHVGLVESGSGRLGELVAIARREGA